MGGRGTGKQKSGIGLVKPGKQCSARQDALRRLGFKQAPEINPLAVYAVQVAGSKQKFLAYARTSDHLGVQSLIEKYDSLSPSDRRALSITDLCIVCDLNFGVLLGEVSREAFNHNADVSRLLAAVWQPRVVKATIDSAIKYAGPDGVRDRQMLHTHSNFVPVPKSASTVFKFQQQINNSTGGDDEPSGLPSFSSDIITLNAAQRATLLPAPEEEE